MAHVIFLRALLRREFKITSPVRFGSKTRPAVPGHYLKMAIRTLLFDADDDFENAKLACFDLVHNKRVDTKLLVDHLLTCKFNKRNFKLVRRAEWIEFETRDTFIRLSCSSWKAVYFRLTDPRTKEDFAWGIAPRNLFIQRKRFKNLVTIPQYLYPSVSKVDFDDDECAVCQLDKRTVLFDPCGHFCTCARCALYLNTCPKCRVSISQKHLLKEIRCHFCKHDKNLFWCTFSKTISCESCGICNKSIKIFA